MLRVLLKFASFPLLFYVLGFAWFTASLPGPAGDERTDGIVVLTGAKGRLDRGFDLIERGVASRLLISGVDATVRPRELAAQYEVDEATLRCCVDLGFAATDTRTNGEEVAGWVREKGLRSIRLVTSDWHMPRARREIASRLDAETTILSDPIVTSPSLQQLFLEYNKLLVSPFADRLGIE